jgi:hypothetical protein
MWNFEQHSRTETIYTFIIHYYMLAIPSTDLWKQKYDLSYIFFIDWVFPKYWSNKQLNAFNRPWVLEALCIPMLNQDTGIKDKALRILALQPWQGNEESCQRASAQTF